MNIEAFIEFHTITEKLKHLKRTGWVLREVPDPESVASHTFRMALMVLTLQKELESRNIDFLKVLKMVLYHDIGESLVGDIVPECVERQQVNGPKITKQNKYQIELKALTKLANIVDNKEIVHLWTEIEENKTKEALIVKDLDLIDMALQAWQYKQRYADLSCLDEFLPYCNGNIKTKLGKDILDAIASKW